MNRRAVLTIFLALTVGAGALYAQTDELEAFLDRGRELSKAQKFDQALPYFLFALELGEKEFGADSPAVVPMLNDLGEIYVTRENFTDAEPLLERSLSIQEKALSRYQAGIARTLNNLGTVYAATAREDEARKLYQRVATVFGPSLGKDHPSVRAARERLAELTPPEVPPRVADRQPAVAPAYRVHLTSIRNREDSAEEWHRLQGIYPGLLGDLQVAVTRVDLGAQGGVWYRVQGTPLDRTEARQLCAAFRRRGVWCDVVRGEPAPARVATTEPQVAPPEPEPEAEAGFRIHLTSIRDPADAEAEWRRLRRLYESLLGELTLSVRRADLGPERGVWYRIQGGPLGRAEARDRCSAFAQLKVWCRIVPPPGSAAGGGQRQVALRVHRRYRSGHRGTRRPLRRFVPEPGTRRFADAR